METKFPHVTKFMILKNMKRANNWPQNCWFFASSFMKTIGSLSFLKY